MKTQYFIRWQFTFVSTLLLCASMLMHSDAQPLLEFEHFSAESGLSNSNSTDMMVDNKGFFWIATIDGVNRYDGYGFKIFRNNPFDASSISIGWPLAMAEDQNRIIWIGSTTPQGLNRYDPVKQKFTRYSENPKYKSVLPESWIQFIYVDDENNLWLSADGIVKFDPKKNAAQYFKHDEKDTTSLGSNSPYIICKADEHHLYVSTSYGFDILNTENAKCRHFRINDYKKVSTSQLNEAVSIFKDQYNKLWICTQQGLKMFDPVTEQITTYRHDKNNPNSISCDSVNSICESPDGRLWITTSGGGLNIFDRSSQKFFHYMHDDKDPKSISSNTSYRVVYHPSGKIFIQLDFVIDAVNLQPAKFKSFTHDAVNKNSISNNLVGHIFSDRHNQIFICTSHGLNLFDPVAEKFDLYQPDQKVNYIYGHSSFDAFYEDREGNYWVEADENKLVMYNPVTHYSKIFNSHEQQPDSLSLGYVWSIYEDKNGMIWINGPPWSSVYNPKTGKFRQLLLEPAKGNGDFNGAGTLISEYNGKMWVTSSNGIHCFDQQKDKFIHPDYSGHKEAEALQRSWTISCLAQDETKFWIGTMGQGLFYINSETGDCISITADDGLPNNVVWAIMKDDHSNLWISTNNGLCRFTPSYELLKLDKKNISSIGTFRNYNTSDGIPVKELSNNLPGKTKDGKFLFALYADKGLIMFHPDSLKDNSNIPPVYITEFLLFNKAVMPSDSGKFLRTSIEATKEIVLSYHENVFSFEFAALNFIHPEKNRYAYKLEPFNKDWIYTDATKRFANYTNLDPGEYIFKVKGSNNDGVWNETPATLKLIITPPYWETWWFRFLIIVTVAAAVYVLYRFRINQLMKLQAIRNRIAHDLHDNIGSTLNSISIYSEVAQNKSKEKIPELDLIGESSRKVMDAMSDIVWTINPENDSFEKIIFRMRSHVHLLMKAKNIEYTFKADEKLNELTLPMQVRKNFYLIFKEAVNNLLKYSNATRVSISLNYFNHTIQMLICDNGVGFDIANPPRGNGLNSMKQRANEIRAVLKIESEIGKGTSVELNLKTK